MYVVLDKEKLDTGSVRGLNLKLGGGQAYDRLAY
jgi:hypothetical protein